MENRLLKVDNHTWVKFLWTKPTLKFNMVDIQFAINCFAVPSKFLAERCAQIFHSVFDDNCKVPTFSLSAVCSEFRVVEILARLHGRGL